MVFEETFVIPRPINDVWDFFSDIPAVSVCVPGVKRIEQTGDGVYEGVLNVKIGPIAANFNGHVRLAELEPPHRLVAKVEGKDRTTASVVSGNFIATLKESESGGTEVSHRINVVIRGRLGQFGTGVIHEVTKEITEIFATCVRRKLAPDTDLTETASAGSNEPGTTRSPSKEHDPLQAPGFLTIILRAIYRVFRGYLSRFRDGQHREQK